MNTIPHPIPQRDRLMQMARDKARLVLDPDDERFCGPYSPALASIIEEALMEWCETPELYFELSPRDVCEAILPLFALRRRSNGGRL